MRSRRRQLPRFKIGDFVEHKHDPDVYGTVIEISEEGSHFTVQTADGGQRGNLGFWLLQKSSLLEAMARASNRNFRGPGA